MKARLVTAYVPIAGHPRSVQEYGELGERLGGVPVRKKAFYQEVGSTWLAGFLRMLPSAPSWSTYDNPEKNSLAYHCVQHQKTEWLKQAAAEYEDDDVFVWVDYGIFHQPGVCNEAIYNFMERVDDKAIYAPGCWNATDQIPDEFPSWRFCGSVLSVPRRLIEAFDDEVKMNARAHIYMTRNVSWEVNTWARVERRTKLPLRWYKADHDVSQFTNLPVEKANEPA